MGSQINAIWHGIVGALQSETGRSVSLVVVGAVVAWIGNFVSGWWRSRDRYQAHVTWLEGDTRYGPQDQPVVVIQSIHALPINVTRIKLRNGFGLQSDGYPFAGDDPDDFPVLPRRIEPMQSTTFWLDSDAFDRALEQSRFLKWLWVPRVYIGVSTMGRGERRFVAEGGLRNRVRRRRYR